jgi:hypothetical protein
MALFTSGKKRPGLSANGHNGHAIAAAPPPAETLGGAGTLAQKRPPLRPSTLAIDLASDEYETPSYLRPFPQEVKRVGLIAGGGQFPILLAQAARSRGVEVTAFALKDFASDALQGHVDAIEWLELGALGKLIKRLKDLSLRQVAMVGRVAHANVLTYRHFDARAMKLLASALNRKADTLLELLCCELAKEGVEVLDSTFFLRSFLPKPGQITKKRKLSAREREDIDFRRSAGPPDRRHGHWPVDCREKKKWFLAVEGAEGNG